MQKNAQKSHPFANFIQLELFQAKEWLKMRMDAFFGRFKT
jgi:hypothetical protein